MVDETMDLEDNVGRIYRVLVVCATELQQESSVVDRPMGVSLDRSLFVMHLNFLFFVGNDV